MIFADLSFVCVFFTVSLFLQILIPSVKIKNIILLVCSLVFYAWAGLRFVLVLLFMVYVCKVGALHIEKARLNNKRGDVPLGMTVGVCISILVFFKYTGFLASIFDAHLPQIVLPVGISFYTFQLVSYLFDVYNGETAAQKKYWMLLLYTSLFHQCIAGPIVRYRDVYDDLTKREMTVEKMSEGISRFSIGLAKKAVLANGCAQICDPLLNLNAENMAAATAFSVSLGIIIYLFQYYFDFSAYSDMAIGMGLMYGLRYKENFNYPFISKSLGELWRRWHISLGTFFRDYVYIPLGGSRCGNLVLLRNLFVVWLLTGVWHGAGWNYILWGLYFFLLLAIGKFVVKNHFDFLPSAVKILGTFLLLALGTILIRFTDLSMAALAVKSIFMLNGNEFITAADLMLFDNNVYFLAACVAFATPLGNFPRVYLKEKADAGNVLCLSLYCLTELCLPILLLIVSVNALAGDSYNPFLYFQF